MDSLEERYGFDANFVDEVLDFFKCIVCHLVLRQPVQIMTCGHRFCRPCFERIQGYSQHLNTELCCPIDREPIDVNKVFEDIGLSREIGNFQVKCSSLDVGCLWQGDLRSLQDHEKDCQYKVKIQDAQEMECEKQDGLMKEVLQCLQKCEQSLMEKEKDMAHMKFNIHELKSMSDRKEKEMDSLQISNIELRNEVKMMKELNEEMKSHFEKEIMGEKKIMDLSQLSNIKLQKEIKVMKELNEEMKSHFEREITGLKDENKILDTRLKSLEDKVIEKKDGLKESEVKEMLEKQMKDLKISSTNKLSDDEETAQMEFEKSLLPIKNELTRLQKDVQKQINEIRAVQSSTDKTMNEECSHVNNIENILFRYIPYVNKEVKLQWLLTDYNYHFAKGEDVESPIFYPQLNRYRFKLKVKWTGAKKENFGLGLKLCRGRIFHGDLKPFRVEYELAVFHKNGTFKNELITKSELDMHKDDCFIILPNQQEAQFALCYNMLTKREVKDYLINGNMYLTCTFKLS